jgi:hypothetical protein
VAGLTSAKQHALNQGVRPLRDISPQMIREWHKLAASDGDMETTHAHRLTIPHSL